MVLRFQNGFDSCMKAEARFQPRFRTVGLMNSVHANATSMRIRKIRDAIAVSEHGYSAPFGRQGDDTLYIY